MIVPSYPVAGRGRRPYPVATMLRAHLMQSWFGLSDPAMEEALYEISSMRKFARLTLQAILDDTTILDFRRLIGTNELAPMIFGRANTLLTRKGLMLKCSSIVDATIIAVPSSTKNADGKRGRDGSRVDSRGWNPAGKRMDSAAAPSWAVVAGRGRCERNIARLVLGQQHF